MFSKEEKNGIGRNGGVGASNPMGIAMMMTRTRVEYRVGMNLGTRRKKILVEAKKYLDTSDVDEYDFFNDRAVDIAEKEDLKEIESYHPDP
mmetsp:Transcript_22148/g.46309  ORF Transcript_22148/g.46309 Transcript_22148/m.46309 type:complete len:91 (+) Transcript_22148:2156-2428(+)